MPGGRGVLVQTITLSADGNRIDSTINYTRRSGRAGRMPEYYRRKYLCIMRQRKYALV